ncbi:ATP-binding protein [Streptomyces rishiriensis]|uniref:Anti-sigma regulatory factor (Ser/Thr protein kinase) n=1 Tax=Streptomyces rishiriensis TaxID=68264 RepID=A0ABU0P203_STRRH|nr:ATP-binding protein [Streptomyces rishiriensis]MDQ0585420.1 anti-sigma regulatory factor (Ser/Thr protein kinase) [Streptomyces rishiriensis]
MRSHADDDGCTAPGEHLLRAGYALDGDGACIADARHHAVAFLDRAHAAHRLPVSARARDLTQLVVSELVTNALKYAPGPVLLELRIDVRAVEVVVRDGDPAVPAARAADPGRIGQHGLEIVKAVTEDLSIEQEPAGKRITARIALTDTPGATAAGSPE